MSLFHDVEDENDLERAGHRSGGAFSRRVRRVRFEPGPYIDPDRWEDGSDEPALTWMADDDGREWLSGDSVTEFKYKLRCDDDSYWDGDRAENGYESVGDSPDPRESAIVSISGAVRTSGPKRDEADEARVFPHATGGTGVMITDRHVLTAAHVVELYDTPFTFITVCTQGNRYPGAECILVSGADGPVDGADIRWHPDWYDSPDRSRDLAIIRLPRPFTVFPGVMCLSDLTSEEEIFSRSWHNAGYPATKVGSCESTKFASPPNDPYSAHREDDRFWSYQMQRTKRSYSGWKVRNSQTQYKGLPYAHGASGGPVYHCGQCRASDLGWVLGVMSATVHHGVFLSVHEVGHNPMVSAATNRRWILDNVDGEIDDRHGDDQCWKRLDE